MSWGYAFAATRASAPPVPWMVTWGIEVEVFAPAALPMSALKSRVKLPSMFWAVARVSLDSKTMGIRKPVRPRRVSPKIAPLALRSGRFLCGSVYRSYPADPH